MCTAPLSTTSSAPTTSVVKLIGPGLLVAAAGIGAGDIVSSTMAASAHGLRLLWVVALAAFLKCVLNEGIARWQLASGMTAIEGWTAHLPWWVRVYFAFYLVIWTISVSAALTSASGLGVATLTSGAVPQSWGAIAHSLPGCAVVLPGGFKGFEKMMKVLIATMFFSIIACAALTFSAPAAFFRGLFVPTIPPAGGSTVLSVIGGIGGSVTMLAYNYWMREEKMAGPGWLRFVRADIAIAYVFTAIFGMAVMIVANQTFHVAGMQITNAQAVTKMAETLGAIVGPIGFYTYAIGFWAAVFASLLGVWQSVPYLFADYYGLMRKLFAARAGAPDLGDEHAVPGGAAIRHARADTVRVRRSAAHHHPDVHDRRQPLHPVPGRHAHLSEQLPHPAGERRAEELDADEYRARVRAGLVCRRRRL